MRFFKSKKKKVKEKYLIIWAGIIAKYDLRIPQEWYHHIARALGSAEGKSGFSRLVSSIKKGGIFGIFTAIAAVATGGVLGFLAGALTLAQHIQNAIISQKSDKIATALNAIQTQRAILKQKQELAKQGDKLTEYLVYADYEIYANGNIYNKNNPGSQSYSPSLAYDTSKGIYGQATFNAIDEQTQNRAHFTAAGNKGYFQQSLGVPQPLAEFNLSMNAINDSLENRARDAQKRIVNGFNELAANKYNYLGNLNDHYKWVVSKQVHPFFKKMCNNDFLDRLQTYKKAQRADFNYLFMSAFIPQSLGDKALNALKHNVLLGWPNIQRNRQVQLEQYYRKMNAEFLKDYDKNYELGLIDVSPNSPLHKVTPQELADPSLRPVYRSLLGSGMFRTLPRLFTNYQVAGYFEWNMQRKAPLLYKEWYANIINSNFMMLEINIFIVKPHPDYIQLSPFVAYPIKAKDFLEKVDAFIAELIIGLDETFYKISNQSLFTYKEQEFDNTSMKMITKTKSLTLNAMQYKSVNGNVRNFYSLEHEILECECPFINELKTNNNLVKFYFACIEQYVGTATFKNLSLRCFMYKDTIAYFKNIQDFDLFLTPLLMHPILKDYDFNKIQLDFYQSRPNV